MEKLFILGDLQVYKIIKYSKNGDLTVDEVDKILESGEEYGYIGEMKKGEDLELILPLAVKHDNLLLSMNVWSRAEPEELIKSLPAKYISEHLHELCFKSDSTLVGLYLEAIADYNDIEVEKVDDNGVHVKGRGKASLTYLSNGNAQKVKGNPYLYISFDEDFGPIKYIEDEPFLKIGDDSLLRIDHHASFIPSQLTEYRIEDADDQMIEDAICVLSYSKNATLAQQLRENRNKKHEVFIKE